MHFEEEKKKKKNRKKKMPARKRRKRKRKKEREKKKKTEEFNISHCYWSLSNLMKVKGLKASSFDINEIHPVAVFSAQQLMQCSTGQFQWP